jgi:hypothetical protein
MYILCLLFTDIIGCNLFLSMTSFVEQYVISYYSDMPDM